MPRRPRGPARPSAASADTPAAPLDDNFLDTLKGEFARVQQSANAPKPGEDLSHRAEVNRRLLQDFWEIHNQFDDVGSHLTIEPSQTLFATFAEFPDKWSFRENFDFGGVKTIELRDRTQGWVGFTLRFWFYNTNEGRPHFRGVFEWTDGETYHRVLGLDAHDEPGRALTMPASTTSTCAPCTTSCGTSSCAGTRRTWTGRRRRSSRT